MQLPDDCDVPARSITETCPHCLQLLFANVPVALTPTVTSETDYQEQNGSGLAVVASCSGLKDEM